MLADICSGQDRLPGGAKGWEYQRGPGRWTELGGESHFQPFQTFPLVQPGLLAQTFTWSAGAARG